MKINFPSKEEFLSSNPTIRFFFPTQDEEYLYTLFLVNHPDSPLFPLSIDDRINYVENVLKSPYEPLSEDIDTLLRYTLSLEQRALTDWLNTLHERQKFFASIPYTLETVDIKDAMLARTPKLWDDYERVKKKLMESEDKTEQGLTESLSEKGLIW